MLVHREVQNLTHIFPRKLPSRLPTEVTQSSSHDFPHVFTRKTGGRVGPTFYLNIGRIQRVTKRFHSLRPQKIPNPQSLCLLLPRLSLSAMAAARERNFTTVRSIVAHGTTRLRVIYTNDPNRMRIELDIWWKRLLKEWQEVGLDLEYTNDEQEVAVIQLCLGTDVLVYHYCKYSTSWSSTVYK